jgi:hypothetical protein
MTKPKKKIPVAQLDEDRRPVNPRVNRVRTDLREGNIDGGATSLPDETLETKDSEETRTVRPLRHVRVAVRETGPISRDPNEDPRNFAELLAAFKNLKATTPQIAERPKPKDSSFIDQFHQRLTLIERNNGQYVFPHPDDDTNITRETPAPEDFALKPKKKENK